MRLQLSEKKVKELEEFEETPEYKPSLVKVLNIIAVIMCVILIIVIYLPASIWREEDAIRKLGRKRLSILTDVESFYRQMAGEYQPDPVLAMKVLSAVRDSTRADSNFYDSQKIILHEGTFKMDVVNNFYLNFDTTFALSYQRRDTVLDTSYQVVIWNEELFSFDTIFVYSSRINEVKNDSLFRGLINTEINPRVTTDMYYRKYYLDSSIAYSPLNNEQYEVILDEDNIRIQDPLEGEYREPRFLVFAFKDTSCGYIVNGEKSWSD